MQETMGEEKGSREMRRSWEENMGKENNFFLVDGRNYSMFVCQKEQSSRSGNIK